MPLAPAFPDLNACKFLKLPLQLLSILIHLSGLMWRSFRLVATIEFAVEFCWLLMTNCNLQPARLKFSKCSDHVEFTRGPFSLCKNFVVVRKYPELFFFHQVLILRLMGKELQLPSQGQLFLFYFFWCSITNASGPAIVACIMNDFGTISVKFRLLFYSIMNDFVQYPVCYDRTCLHWNLTQHF